MPRLRRRFLIPTLALTLAATVAATPTQAQPLGRPPSLDASGRIAYHGTEGIAVIRADGSGGRTILQGQHPDWSPDGRRLVYSVDEPDGTTDLWIADRSGGHAHRLVDCAAPCAFDEDPAWSPDGTKIVFWSNDGPDDLTQPLVIVDARTGTELRHILLPGLVGPTHPRWSPDGSHLAVEVGYYREAPGGIEAVASRIVTIDLLSRSAKFNAVTPKQLWAGYPDWSRREDELVFQAGNPDPFSRTGPASNLYVVRPDGSGLRRVTHQSDSDGWVALPDWGSGTLLVTLIRASGKLVLATVTPRGDVKPLRDASGGPVIGAHPRLSTCPCR